MKISPDPFPMWLQNLFPASRPLSLVFGGPGGISLAPGPPNTTEKRPLLAGNKIFDKRGEMHPFIFFQACERAESSKSCNLSGSEIEWAVVYNLYPSLTNSRGSRVAGPKSRSWVQCRGRGSNVAIAGPMSRQGKMIWGSR